MRFSALRVFAAFPFKDAQVLLFIGSFGLDKYTITLECPLHRVRSPPLLVSPRLESYKATTSLRKKSWLGCAGYNGLGVLNRSLRN